MSSTSNVQNLLTNVFRPTFVFDTTNGVYQSKLELTNVDSVSANTVYTFAASVGDASGNVYVGTLAGNENSLLAIKANSNTTFVGTGAGTGSSSIVESVFIGYRAGASAASSSYSVSIGATSKSAGNSNVFIGYGSGVTSGSNNIFIGTNVTNTGTVNNKLLIGSGATAAMMVGDLSNNRIGVNLSNLTDFTTDTRLVVNGITRIGGTTNNGRLGINTTPSDFHLDVNGTQRISNSQGTLTFGTDAIQSSSGGFNSSNGTTSSGIGTSIAVKKGMFILSATSNTSRHAVIGVASSTSAYTIVSQNSNDPLITADGSALSVAAGTVGWNITYFPTP
jgi:hypothetical protein